MPKSHSNTKLQQIIVGILILMLVACTPSPIIETAPEPTDISVQETEVKTEEPSPDPNNGLLPGKYRVGFSATTTGLMSFAGVPLSNGVNLAVKEINETAFLGEGVTIEVWEQDDGADQATAINITNQFVSDPTILGVVCCVSSNVTLAMKPILMEANVPTVIYSAIREDLVEGDYMYRSSDSNIEREQKATRYVMEKWNPQNVVIFVTIDNDGQASILETKKAVLEDLGISYSIIETFSADTDFRGAATQAIALSPDAVVITQTGEAGALTVAALRELGYDGNIFGNDVLSNKDLFDIAGDALLGIPMPVTFSPVSPLESAQKFVNYYVSVYGDTPDIYAAQGYQAVWMIAVGLKNGGEGSREALQNGMQLIETIETPGGTFTIDQEGQAHAVEISFIQWGPDRELIPWE